VAEATVQDLTGDFSKMHIKLRFKVHSVSGLDAHTMFYGHDLTSDYVRRLTRRKRTKTDAVVDVTTKDGWEIRVKPMAVSEQRIQASQETAIRNIMREEIKRIASEVTIGEFVKMLIMGDLIKAVSEASKSIVPIKRIEIRRSEVIKVGKPPEPGEAPITAPAAPEETAGEASGATAAPTPEGATAGAQEGVAENQPEGADTTQGANAEEKPEGQ
ncbi:MAG: 30S ribosomal protein S3ae, partial [Thermoplasmata archaeon]